MGKKIILTYKPEIVPQISNWNAFEQKIKNPEIRKQHHTTGTKVEIAKYHLRKILSILPNQQLTDVARITYDGKTNQHKFFASNLEAQQYLACLAEYDSFLFSLRGCIDSLLLEINSIYGLTLREHAITTKKIQEKMSSYYEKDPLTNYLTTTFQSDWFKYITGLRNMAAHRINFPLYASIDLEAPTNYPLYLPDNPTAPKISLNNNFKILPKLNELLTETENFLNISYNLFNQSKVSLKL
jgi:hypothetical protein